MKGICQAAGLPAWHTHESCLGLAVSASVRTATMSLHDFRPITESWVEWHRRFWRQAKAQLSEAWGDHPACLMVARAVGGAQ